MPSIPKFVNRGPAGLLTKLKKEEVISEEKEQRKPIEIVSKGINRIAKSLESLVVDIDSLIPDPDNARLHPERNSIAIEQSLNEYGQLKPIVVRKETNTVVAGNGTLEAAKALGWTKIAAVFEDMSDIDAMAYALADNRTAELARWDLETLARQSILIDDNKKPAIGWSVDEMEVLRASTIMFVPATIDDSNVFGDNGDSKEEPLALIFSQDQYDWVGKAIEKLREVLAMNQDEIDQSTCLMHICRDWYEERIKNSNE